MNDAPATRIRHDGRPGSLDGRTARRDRGRAAVLDAVIALFEEGASNPSPEVVAARSGVSLRSVYRYFQDRDDIARAATNRHLQQFAPLGYIPGLGEGPLAERIDRLVAGRLRLYEAVGAVARAARLRSATRRGLAEGIVAGRRALTRQTEQMFAPELDAMEPTQRAAIAVALDVLTQFEALDEYTLVRGYTLAETTQLLTNILHALLRGAAAGVERAGR